MAVTRRGYIFGAFLSSVLSAVLVMVSISSDSWVVSSTTMVVQVQNSLIQYGLFSGALVLRNQATSTSHSLYMTCVTSVSACALSCKNNAEARRIEVEALANGYRPTAGCVGVTDVNTANPLPVPPVISFPFYVCLLLVLFLQLLFSIAAAVLGLINTTRNPIEPIIGLPGCLWCNLVTAVCGVVALLMFGVYWATSGLRDHLAITYVAVGEMEPSPALGYSFWVLIPSIFCNLSNVTLVRFRSYLLERDSPSSTTKLETQTAGTMLQY